MNPNPYGSQYGASQQYGQPGYQQQANPQRSQPPLVYPTSCHDPKAQTSGSYVLGGDQSTTSTTPSCGSNLSVPCPTLKPNYGASSQSDIVELKKSFEGVGCDEKMVLEILCRRSSKQREKIKSDYITEFGKSLLDRIKKELFEPLDKVVRCLLYTGPDLDAYYIRKATKGPSIDPKVITHIMVTRSHRQLCQIKESFSKKHSQALADVFSQQLTGKYRDTMIYLLNNPRTERDTNPSLAAQQAAAIYNKNMAPSTGLDPLIQIVCLSSYHQIIAIASAFENAYRQPLEAFLGSFGGDFETFLLAICTYSLNPNRYFARELKAAIVEHDFKRVTMIIITRCEIDLGHILNEYLTLYGTRAEADIQSAFQGQDKSSIDAFLILMGLK